MRIGNYRYDQEVAVDLLEKVGLAVLVLIVTWALAKGAKWAFAKLVDNVAFFRRATGSGASLGESLGKIVGLLIWLFGLLVILTVLGLETGVPEPFVPARRLYEKHGFAECAAFGDYVSDDFSLCMSRDL